MKFKTVSNLFGGSHIPHLVCPSEKDDVLKNFSSKTLIHLPEKKSPFQMLSPNNYMNLKKGYYAMCIPDDLGVFLHFVKYEGENCCFILCRKLSAGFDQPKILITFPSFQSDSIFKGNGTLIEATRVYASDNRFFMIMTDIHLYKGESTRSLDFIDRLEALGEFMRDDFKEDLYQFPFRLQIVTPFEHLNLLEQRIQNLPYKVDRILFYPADKNNPIYTFVK